MTETAYSEAQKLAIGEALQRLVLSSHFSHSKRFPSFLEFIIREELAGRGHLLRERTLGVAVFGRAAGYDTTSDPIVRVTAAEIRKRLAQYYHEPGSQDEVQISLPPGSYVPHFAWVACAAAVEATAPLPDGEEPRSTPHPVANTVTLPESSSAPPWTSSPGPSASRKPKFRMVLGSTLVTLVALLLLAGAWSWKHAHASTLDRFWAPVLQADTTVIVCFPRYEVDSMKLRSASDPEHTMRFTEPTQAVNVDDLGPLVSITGLLQQRHQRFLLLGQDVANLTDLRRGPGIFIGAFNNAWVLRATNGLRFRFNNDAAMQRFWIEDTAGSHRHWQIDRREQVATNNYRDYAIVARFNDGSTGQPTVISAGIARGGTIAAGEFLTEPANIDRLREFAPPNWESKNVEVVISTEIIDGRSAPPKIEATYFW